MWLSVSIRTDAMHAEALSEALLARGAISVSIEDADAGTGAETPQYGEPGGGCATPFWDSSRIVALFEPAEDLAAQVAGAVGKVSPGDTPEIEITEIAEQDWVRLTRSQFEPIRINDRLWIVPSWHAAPDPGAINLAVDPGLAFGTGSHPTTRLCLDWLCEKVSGDETVLDYGCGSGILGIAAARLGAGSVLGVDIDPDALEAARENAARNGVPLELRDARAPLVETFDLVVANILTNPLCVLAPLLADRLAAGGQLALSGVLASQARQVTDAYAPYLPLRACAELEGWVRLEGERP